MHTVTLFERAASGAAHALRHPISSAAYAAGFVRGLASAGRRAASEHGAAGLEGRTEPLRPTTFRGVPVQRGAPAVEQYDVPLPRPTPLHEAFASEPRAVSRSAEHGRASDAEIDAWIDQAMEGLDADSDRE